MSISGVNGALANMYQYANRTQKAGTSGASFTEQLQKTGEAADMSKVDAYTEYLRSKYGNVRIQSVGKDKQSLDRAGKSMSGSDVVIAPNILEQMANDPEKAAYYEGKIDDFFNATPRLKAQFAAQGLDYQPCGVVVHEDGSVTYIGGCGDSPERVAEVNAINKAKREKEAAQRKAGMERSQEAAEERKEQLEIIYKQKTMTEFLSIRTMDTSRVTYTATPEVLSSAITAYEQNIMEASGILK
ncbi:MAG: hypothetical protein HFI10_05995 [Lachnospiraceae bacterium]|nr:hypothetical protein [Lachnospiraceae bacterium]